MGHQRGCNPSIKWQVWLGINLNSPKTLLKNEITLFICNEFLNYKKLIKAYVRHSSLRILEQLSTIFYRLKLKSHESSGVQIQVQVPKEFLILHSVSSLSSVVVNICLSTLPHAVDTSPNDILGNVGSFLEQSLSQLV